MLRVLLNLSVVFTILLGAIACDSNEVSDDADPALTEPDDEVIAQAGPANQVVRSDISRIITEMDRLLYMYIPKAMGQDGGLSQTSDDYQDASLDTCVPNTIGDNVTCNVDLSPLIDADCDETGAKSITSFVTITVEEDRLSGQFEGNFSIEYSDDCQEKLTMDITGSDTCEATTTMSGTIETTISEWSFIVSSDSAEEYNSEFSIQAETEEAPLSVVVSWYNTEQNYLFDYTAFLNTSLDDLQPDDDSTIEVADVWYYSSVLATAVTNAASSVACYE